MHSNLVLYFTASSNERRTLVTIAACLNPLLSISLVCKVITACTQGLIQAQLQCMALQHCLTDLCSNHFTLCCYVVCFTDYSSMVPGNLPNQLEILSTGQTYFETCFETQVQYSTTSILHRHQQCQLLLLTTVGLTADNATDRRLDSYSAIVAAASAGAVF